jgi:hypothetical protein
MVLRTGWAVRWLALGLLASICGTAACGRAEVRFDVDNARAHVNMLAGTIGSRPVGSEANVKARNYLIDQLRLYGFDVRVQETDAVSVGLSATAHVANVIAFKAGARRDAIGIIAHYDSVAAGPGATDDGLGTAVALEAARVLGAMPSRNYSLLVLLTDGEEAGLMGASAAVTDPEIVQRLRAYLNVESIGSAGPTVLFESGPSAQETLPLLKAWARGAPHPHGGSYAIEIYKRLPNDTDFTIFKSLGIPGLNFAAIGDGYSYHTARDTPERLTNDVLRQTGETVVGTTAALDAAGLPDRDTATASTQSAGSTLVAGAGTGTSGAPPRYFDIGGQMAVVIGPTTGRIVTIVAILIALFAWVRLLRATLKSGVLRVLVSIIWMVLAVAGGALGVAAAAWLLRHGREVFHPWYAHPDRFLLLLVLSGITAWWYITRLMYLLPEGGRSLRAPAAIWVVALPIWVGLAGYMEYVAPAAAVLWSVPLLAAGILLAIVPARVPMLVRFASLLIAAVTAALWLRDGHDVFVFLVGVFSRMPFVEPFWVFPAFIILCAIMLAPPFLAMVTGMIRGRLAQGIASSLLLVALATAMGLAYFAEAYSTARPQRRTARYLADLPAGKAWWEIGGNEPGLDLNVTPAEAPRWRPQPERTPPQTTVQVPLFYEPYIFRAEADRIDPPADVAMSAITRGDTTEIDVTVVPKMAPLNATFVLPSGVDPLQANLAGRRTAYAFLSVRPVSGTPPTSRLPQLPLQPHNPQAAAAFNDAASQANNALWRARFIAIPPTGVAFRATVPTALAGRLAETTVFLTASRLPGADQPRWPMWLPQDRAVWTMVTSWIVRPPLATKVEPVPAEESRSLPATPLPGAALPSPTLPPATTMPSPPPR